MRYKIRYVSTFNIKTSEITFLKIISYTFDEIKTVLRMFRHDARKDGQILQCSGPNRNMLKSLFTKSFFVSNFFYGSVFKRNYNCFRTSALLDCMLIFVVFFG